MINPEFYAADAKSLDIATDIPDTVEKLLNTGCYMPDIERILFNYDPKKNNVLATVVYFADGSKVSVSNSVNDGLKLDKDGKISAESREIGVIYAVMKRLFASRYDIEDDRIVLKSEGLGTVLRKLVKNAYDQPVEDAKNLAAKKAAKAEYAKKMAADAEKKAKHVSMHENMEHFDEILTRLEKLIAAKTCCPCPDEAPKAADEIPSKTSKRSASAKKSSK